MVSASCAKKRTSLLSNELRVVVTAVTTLGGAVVRCAARRQSTDNRCKELDVVEASRCPSRLSSAASSSGSTERFEYTVAIA